ncbi:Mrp/NBP35 family ATP-binding protein [bacterium]|nr:Mrp/NBP35 family ATP-binding protein [bacterium]
MPNKQLNAKEIEDLLKQITYPGFSRDIVSFGIVRSIDAEGPQVTVALEFSTSDQAISQKVAEEVGQKLSDAGIEAVDIQVNHHNPQADTGTGEANDAPDLLPTVKHVIAVASGKGGVGKSTVAANLAIGLGKLGLKVGLMDADIYGPSVQMLLGLSDEPEPAEGENKLKPMEAYGIKAMSMGVLVDSDTPLVWRGPMVSSAVEQLLRDVVWGELDVLVLDMPPGTGDIQLTVAQKVKLTGAVIVTTPQELALIDARKGIGMFQKVDVPVLGLVENMSYFLAPDTGKRYEIFSSGGARREALRQRVPFLGEIPLQAEIREGSDAGKPAAAQDNPVGDVFRQLADRVWKSVNQPVMQ